VGGPSPPGGDPHARTHRNRSRAAVASAVADAAASRHADDAAAIAVASAQRAAASGVDASDALEDVQLIAVPVRLYADARDHDDDLVREFKLITHGGQAGASTVPARLVQLTGHLSRDFARYTDAGYAQLDAAVDADEETADVVFHVPAAFGEGAARLLALLDDADDHCRTGALLTPPSPPEIANFRRWLLGEFARQTAGLEPRPWPDFSREAAG
jgi:hypothetical protein